MLRSLSQCAKQFPTKLTSVFAAFLVFATTMVCLPAQSQQAKTAETSSPAGAPKGKAFAKPADAAAALYAAAVRNDDQELLVILGPDAKDVITWSDDANERREQREQFAQKYNQMHRLVREPDNTVALYVGAENWPLPIPIVEYHGAWYFGTVMGKQEIRYRRIGRNEVAAIEVCRALADAEKDYRSEAHQYTAKFVSDTGSHDGLYWKSADNSKKSPIGPYLAHAGLSASGAVNSEPYHGYYYRILLHGSDDFAILAFPAMYRSSGVMTFLVNPDGTAYEKDLGDRTAVLAKEINSDHPDSTWKQVD